MNGIFVLLVKTLKKVNSFSWFQLVSAKFKRPRKDLFLRGSCSAPSEIAVQISLVFREMKASQLQFKDGTLTPEKKYPQLLQNSLLKCIHRLRLYKVMLCYCGCLY